MAGRKVVFTPFFSGVQTLPRPHYLPLALRGCSRFRIGSVSCLGRLDAPAVPHNREKSTCVLQSRPANTDTKLVTDLIQCPVLSAYRHKKLKNTPFIVKKKASIVKRTPGQHCQTQHLQLINRISSLRFVSQIRTEASCQLSTSR